MCIVSWERLLLVFWIFHLTIVDSVPLYVSNTEIAQNTEIKWNCCLNPFQPSVEFHIEISHLICTANQITGFYMKCNARLKSVKWVNFQLITGILHWFSFDRGSLSAANNVQKKFISNKITRSLNIIFADKNTMLFLSYYIFDFIRVMMTSSK